MSTLLTPTDGSARVLGYDVVRQAKQVREHIGFILGGDRGLYGRLTGKQNIRYFGALNRLDPKTASRRADELLERVGLQDSGDVLVEQYSRGMKQRLHIARGLLTDPEVIFMDEPTIGLDPIGAQELRQYIPELVDQGKTIFLTTHYMLEADMLCDTIALIDKGRLVALGTPNEIKRNFSHGRDSRGDCEPVPGPAWRKSCPALRACGELKLPSRVFYRSSPFSWKLARMRDRESKKSSGSRRSKASSCGSRLWKRPT